MNKFAFHLIWFALGLPQAQSLFESQEVSALRLSNQELEKFERIEKIPGISRAKMVSVREGALSGDLIRIEFFDGSQARFRVIKDKREAKWTGRSGPNFDRFTIRKFGERYSGHFLFKGREFVLVPVKSGTSVLYELSGRMECGLRPRKSNSEGPE